MSNDLLNPFAGIPEKDQPSNLPTFDTTGIVPKPANATFAGIPGVDFGPGLGPVVDINEAMKKPQDELTESEKDSVREHVAPASTDAKDEAYGRFIQSIRGRHESDIPLNDPYWDLKNRYNSL